MKKFYPLITLAVLLVLPLLGFSTYVMHIFILLLMIHVKSKIYSLFKMILFRAITFTENHPNKSGFMYSITVNVKI